MSGLADYLRAGARILDVGCGPGSITAEVALWGERPDLVVGVDHSAALIADARRRGLQLGAANLRFQIADAYRLGFANGAFDVTYSHALLDWLTDPVAALVEQRRVTRPGGVIFARLADLGTQVFYPPCPELGKIIEGLRLIAGRGIADGHWNPFLGRQAATLFRAAGVEPIEVRAWADCFRSASPESHSQLVAGLLRRAAEGTVLPQTRLLLEAGVLDEATFEQASGELDRLVADPGGMSIRAGVFIAGRVP